MSKQNTLYDEYHQSLSELRQMNAKLNSTYTDAVGVAEIPLFPLGEFFKSERTSGGYPITAAQRTKKSPAMASPRIDASASTQSSNSEAQQPTNEPLPKAVATPNATLSTPGTAAQAVAAVSEFCAAGSDGNIRLPQESALYPSWMKALLSDTLGDFCFQLKVLSPAGDGALLNNALNQLSFVSDIREKVAVRVAWFLPFFYGLLGSAVFLMRNVANVRTPAMGWFPIVMRISLGGVAGIVIVWFSSATTPGLENVGSLSVPFAAAFLTGYGIDVLFTLLDRLNRAIGEIPKA